MLTDAPPLRRMWLVAFSSTDDWRCRFLRPGFQHVTAMSWFADTQRWVYVNPMALGLVIECHGGAEFGPRFQQILCDSSVILRFPSAVDRTAMPAFFHCVGAVKALLGVRCAAVTPHGLFRHLIRQGAEIVEHEPVQKDAPAAA